MRWRKVVRWALVLTAGACAEETDSSAGDDFDPRTVELAVAIPGAWRLPDNVRRAGEAQHIRYDDPPPWDGGAHCSGTFTAGARELGEYLEETFPGIRQIQGYNCRQNTANAAQTSVHGTGRAIDVMVPTTGGDADNTVGDEIGNWLVMHAEEIGVQYIIWDRTAWNGSRNGRKDAGYGGPNPHIDHLHVELNTDGANRRTPWFDRPPPNQAPRGYLDAADCNGARGWAQDQDAAERAIDVHLYVDGVPGQEGARGRPVSAGTRRQDLCDAIGSCEHGFTWPLPDALKDGREHTVHAYAIDTAGGPNPELRDSPRTFRCDPPALPRPPEAGVLRHVQSREILAAWGFDFDMVATYPDEALAPYVVGAPLSPAPRLVRAPDTAPVYLEELGVKRHVPNPEALAAWRFRREAIEAPSAEEVDALLTGEPLPPAPRLLKGSGPAVYLLDAPPALWAEPVEIGLPAEVEAGVSKEVTLAFRNRGSRAWAAGEVALAPVAPRDVDAMLCDRETWPSCQRAAVNAAEVAPGAEGRFVFRLHAPVSAAGQTLRVCFGLVLGDYWFDDEGMGGPAEDAICAEVAVVAPAPVSPGSEPSSEPSPSPSPSPSPLPDTEDEAPSGPELLPPAGASPGDEHRGSPENPTGVALDGGCRQAPGTAPLWALVLLLGARRRRTVR